MKTSKVQANSAVEMVISNMRFNAKQDTYEKLLRSVNEVTEHG